MKKAILTAVMASMTLVGCALKKHGVCAWHRIPLEKTTYYYWPVGATFLHRDFWVCWKCEEQRPRYWAPPRDEHAWPRAFPDEAGGDFNNHF